MERKVLEWIKPPSFDFFCSLENSYVRRKQSWGRKILVLDKKPPGLKLAVVIDIFILWVDILSGELNSFPVG